MIKRKYPTKKVGLKKIYQKSRVNFLLPEILDLKKSPTKKVGLILSLDTIFKKIDPVKFLILYYKSKKKINKKK